jgi:CBS domain-containing protein
VVSVPSDTIIEEVAQTMVDNGVGDVVVAEDDYLVVHHPGGSEPSESRTRPSILFIELLL